MKRKIFFLLLCQLFAAGLFAQTIKVQKSLLAPKETGIYHANQATALNTRTGQTLVVWQKLTTNQSTILGRIIGKLGSPASEPFVLSTTAGAAHPSVAFNVVRNEFMVAYDNNPNTQLAKSSIILRRLNAQGRPAGDEVIITTDTVSKDMANFFPKIAYNPGSKGYGIVWLREITTAAQADDGTNGSVGEVITPDGGIGGTPVLLYKTVIEGNQLWGPITMDVAYSPANNKLLLALVQVVSGTRGTQANYFLGTLDPAFNGVTAANFVKINNAPLQLNAGFAWGARMALFRDVPGFVFYTDSGNIKRRKIDLKGNLSGASVVAFKPPKNNTRLVYPSVSFSANSKGRRGILLATQDAFREAGEASTWAQVLNSDGLPLGPPVRVDLTSNTDTALSGTVSALPLKPTDILFRFVSFYTLAQFTAPGQTFTNSGIVKLNLNVTVP